MPNFIDAGRDPCVCVCVFYIQLKIESLWQVSTNDGESERDHLKVGKILKYAPRRFMKISLFKFHKIQYKYNY